jgi:hypothetical protein
LTVNFRDYYDWVVFGDDPAALLSGCLAAKLGLSVLILPLAPGLRAKALASGIGHDPEPNFLLGLGRFGNASGSSDPSVLSMPAGEGLLRQCLGHLELNPSEEALFFQDEIPFQVLTPHSRIRFFREYARFKNELERSFGAELSKKMGLGQAIEKGFPAVHEFWKGLPSRLTLSSLSEGHGELQKVKGKAERKEAIRVQDVEEVYKGLARSGSADQGSWYLGSGDRTIEDLSRDFASTDVEDFLQGVWHLANGNRTPHPSLRELAHFATLVQTQGSVRGGQTALRELLLRIAKRFGAHYPEEAEIRRIFIQNNRLSGVQVNLKGNMLSTGGGAIGTAVSALSALCSPGAKAMPKRMVENWPASGWCFTLALRVRREAIPVGASRRMVWQERHAPPLEIEFASAVDYGLKSEEYELVFIRTILPFAEASLQVEYQRKASGRMLRQFLEICPFAEYHVAEIYPDFREAPVDDESESSRFGGDPLSEAYGFTSLDRIPQNLRVYSGQGGGTRTGVEGLFIVSNESFPELGSLGGTVAALESVAWIAHRCGLDGPLL